MLKQTRNTATAAHGIRSTRLDNSDRLSSSSDTSAIPELLLSSNISSDPSRSRSVKRKAKPTTAPTTARPQRRRRRRSLRLQQYQHLQQHQATTIMGTKISKVGLRARKDKGKRKNKAKNDIEDAPLSAPTPTPTPSLSRNMMRTFKNRDPLFYYEVIQVLGVGSMGSVSKVLKRKEVLGGSARSEVVESVKSLHGGPNNIPVIGGLFRMCTDAFCGEDDCTLSSNSIISSSRNLFQPVTSSLGNTTTDSNTANNALAASTHSYPDRNAYLLSERSNLSNHSASSSMIAAPGAYDVYYALKSIHLNRLSDDTFVEELRNEIAILQRLDHPHIVRPIETFSYRDQLYMVTELCSGGDLYSRDPYTEEDAARIVSSILSAVAYMHSKNICHRDLKYENVLFVNKSLTSEVKLIDFGLSKKYANSDQSLSEGVGTIYTMAPEVLKGEYTRQCDLWSIGVLAFMLLSSQMPFYGKKRRHIVEQIMAARYEFRGRRWRAISLAAKNFVAELLQHDPKDRPTAEEAFANSWLNRRYASTVRSPGVEDMKGVHGSLKAFADYGRLKKLALMVVAHKSTSEEIGYLRKAFAEYDYEKNGIISLNEFKRCLASYNYPEAEVEKMFRGIDIDGTGKIRYTEFLAASIEARGAIKEERIAEAFDRLDSDDSGYISVENLRELLGDDLPQEEIEAIIAEADLTKDNRISYGEFLALWDERNEEERQVALEEIKEVSAIALVPHAYETTLEHKPMVPTTPDHSINDPSEIRREVAAATAAAVAAAAAAVVNPEEDSDDGAKEVKEEKEEAPSLGTTTTTLARANFLDQKHQSERRANVVIDVKTFIQSERAAQGASPLMEMGNQLVDDLIIETVPEGAPATKTNEKTEQTTEVGLVSPLL